MTSLHESWGKFKKQQEKCQSVLAKTAAKAGSSRATTNQKATTASISSSTNVKSPAPGFKFSNDTQRLQQVNIVRKSPVGAQIKRVIGLLLETRQALTPEEINEACYVDMNVNKAVFDILRNNPKVKYDGKCFSYKSKYALKDDYELRELIRKYPEGIAVKELKDAYPNVMEDLQALKAAGEIWLLPKFDSKRQRPQDDIAFPNDPRVTIKVDDDLKLLFWGVKLPSDMTDIEKDLQKNGMKPATNTARRKAMAQLHGIPSDSKRKKKERQITARTKLTNAHLPELFPHLKAPRP